MKLIWTKTNTPFSAMIRFLTGDDCSHFAFVFESRSSGLMFESNLLGTHPKFYQTALKHCTVVHEMNVPLSIEEEDEVWDTIVEKYDNKPYDYLGAFYLGIRRFLTRVFGFKKMSVNVLAKRGSFFCNELYEVLCHIPEFPVIDVSSGLMTPHDLLIAIEESKREH